MTLIEQWNEIAGLIEQKKQAFIDQQEGLPTVFFIVHPNGQLKEVPVIKVIHVNYDQNPYYTGKRPTREDIRNIQSIYYNLKLSADFIRLQYDHYNSLSIKQINESRMMFFDREAAIGLSKEITDRIAEENRLLAGGDHDRCQRCRKVVPRSQIVNNTIIGRDRNAFGKSIVTQTPMKFCSGECAAHEQWSWEG